MCFEDPHKGVQPLDSFQPTYLLQAAPSTLHML